MNSTEFSGIRHSLGKSQAQLARLLSVSPRAVQSFEQGWRKVPPSTERQMLFLLFMGRAQTTRIKPCWERKECDLKTKKKCPAWEFRAGNLCWFINGTICGGKVQDNWSKKMQLCRQCEVFRAFYSSSSGAGIWTTLSRTPMVANEQSGQSESTQARHFEVAEKAR